MESLGFRSGMCLDTGPAQGKLSLMPRAKLVFKGGHVQNKQSGGVQWSGKRTMRCLILLAVNPSMQVGQLLPICHPKPKLNAKCEMSNARRR